jgi:hypothetical protein
LVRPELIERLLRPDLDTDANQVIGVHVVNRVTALAHQEPLRRKASQHYLALWSVSRLHDKAGGSKFVVKRSKVWARCLACGKRHDAQQDAAHRCAG